MTNDGGRPYEPTSYHLQEPQNAAQAPHAQHTPQQDVPTYQMPPAQPAPQRQTQPDPGAGRLIAGRYRLLAKLGYGGMGTVWRAKDETVDREVAVKEPRLPDHLPERERANAFERMRREAKAAARLDHPAVVNVHDVAVEDGQPWIVMEFVQGRSLADVLQEGTLDSRETARIGLHVLNALDAAHESGILHRDVKPDNIMLGRYDRVILTDFGIAQIEGETSLTDTGAFVGSPEFVAPERVLGQRPGPASDLWSLGVVLYAATEGVSPFRRNNTPATLQSVLNTTPAAPASAKGQLADAINQLLAKDPGRRPNAARVRELLEEAARPPQQTKIVTVPLGSRLLPAARNFGKRLRSSRRWRYGTVAVLVAAATAVSLIVYLGADRLPDGWKRNENDKALVGATVGLPPDYKRSAADDHIVYTDESSHITVDLVRERNDVQDTALKEANSQKKSYDEGGYKDDRQTMQEVTANVEENTGEDGQAADVFTKYEDWQYPNAPHRWFERVYVKGHVAWKLKVATTPDNAGKGKDIFRGAADSLVSDGL